MTTTHPDIQQALAALQRATEALLADHALIITAEVDRARSGASGYTALIHIYPDAGVPAHLAAKASQQPVRITDAYYDTEHTVDYHGACVLWLRTHWREQTAAARTAQ